MPIKKSIAVRKGPCKKVAKVRVHQRCASRIPQEADLIKKGGKVRRGGFLQLLAPLLPAAVEALFTIGAPIAIEGLIETGKMLSSPPDKTKPYDPRSTPAGYPEGISPFEIEQIEKGRNPASRASLKKRVAEYAPDIAASYQGLGMKKKGYGARCGGLQATVSSGPLP